MGKIIRILGRVRESFEGKAWKLLQREEEERIQEEPGHEFSKFSVVNPKKEEETKSDKRSCISIVTQRRREHIHAP
jgi:hypothetical protein